MEEVETEMVLTFWEKKKKNNQKGRKYKLKKIGKMLKLDNESMKLIALFFSFVCISKIPL